MFPRHVLFGFLLLWSFSLIMPQSWIRKINRMNKRINEISEKTELIHSKTDRIDSNVKILKDDDDSDDFLINVNPNNFVAALPQWGPYFAIQFSIKFAELPTEDKQVKQVMQFFSADPRFEGSVLGSFIPAISVINVGDSVSLAVKMQLTDDDDESKIFRFDNIVTGQEYKVLITQKPATGASNVVKFSVAVTGHDAQTADLPALPIIYNTLGIFVCNSKFDDNANAQVTNLKFNNIDTEKKVSSPVVYGITPTWTPEYAMSLASSFSSLPEQSGELGNLLSLVSTPPGSDGFTELYSQDPNESLGVLDSLLPNFNVLKDKDDSQYYWCFMAKYESGKLPETHGDCDLTNADGSNKPLVTKTHELSFFQTQGKIKASVDGEYLTNKDSGENFVSSTFTEAIKNVKIALGQNAESRKTGSPRFFGLIASALVPAVGQLASVGVNALQNALS